MNIKMPNEQDKEWRNLTFSQREGKAPLPEPLQAGKLTEKFRNQVWYIIDSAIKKCTSTYSYPEEFSSDRTYMRDMFISYRINVFHEPHDEIGTTVANIRDWFRMIVLHGNSHEVLTALEHILRFPSIPEPLAEGIKECFEVAPYAINQSSEPVCIVPTTSKEMKEIVERSLANINQSELTGTKSHFRNAAQALNNNNFSDSVRESIHAVEAAARKIDPESSKSLNAALNSLEKNGLLRHPALKEGIKKLYGYTCDKEGIRHSLIDSEDPDVGFDEAIFMYGACVSFVDYLVSKQRQLEEMSADNKPRKSSSPGDEG